MLAGRDPRAACSVFCLRNYVRATGVLSIGTDPNRKIVDHPAGSGVVESLNEPSCDEVGSEVT